MSDGQTYLSYRQARARVVVHVGRMDSGKLGDINLVGEGVREARIDYGPGYRAFRA